MANMSKRSRGTKTNSQSRPPEVARTEPARRHGSAWKWASLAVGIVVVVAAALWWVSSRTVTPAGHLSAQAAAFVDEASCASCHAAEHKAWTGSHHDRAMQDANAANVLGNFSGANFSHRGGKSKFFQRDGADLYCRVPISMASAALGGEFEVPAIDGSKVKFKVPSGKQTGRRFRLAGKGMPVLRAKQTGDMYVQVAVETPQNLTKRQRELLAEFEKLSSEVTQPESAGFFSRVKEFLDGLGSRGSQSG